MRERRILRGDPVRAAKWIPWARRESRKLNRIDNKTFFPRADVTVMVERRNDRHTLIIFAAPQYEFLSAGNLPNLTKAIMGSRALEADWKLTQGRLPEGYTESINNCGVLKRIA